jgi:hypothetical protein
MQIFPGREIAGCARTLYTLDILVFDKGKLRGCEEFRELCDNNVSLEELTERRRNANFGRLNDGQWRELSQ